MATISFRFSTETDRDNQDRILGRLQSAAGVRTVGRIDPDSPVPLISRMCYVESSDAAVDAILQELQHSSSVEGVEVESRRELIQ